MVALELRVQNRHIPPMNPLRAAISAAYLEAYARLFPDARIATIAVAGHVPQQEQPAAFADTVLTFLND